MSYFSYKELVNARIYDSEGLFYGNICGYEISDKPEIKGCLILNIGDRIPNVEELKKRLRDKGLEVPEDITLEELVITARSEGVEIPYVEVEKRIEMVKGYISLEDIATMDIVYRPGPGFDWRIALVVLNKPREALYRGLPTPVNTPYLEIASKALGKVAVSLSEGILGIVEDLVFAPNDLGLRIDIGNYRRGSILWNSYLALLRTRGYEEHSNILEENIGSHERLDLGYYGYIQSLLEKYKAPPEAYTLLNNSIEFEEEIFERYRDISWKNVLKIGDIVIVK